MNRRAKIMAVMATILSLVGGYGPATQKAFAGAPSQTRISFVFPHPARFLSGLCGFPIIRTDVVNIDVITYSDGTERIVPDGRNSATFTGPSGATLSAQTNGPETVIPNPDGTFTVIFDGPNFHLEVPGTGSVWTDALGRLVLLMVAPPAPHLPVPGSLVITVVSETPQNENSPNFGAVCTYLAGS